MVIKLSKETAVRAVNVILRVPALFIVEAWYRTDPNSMSIQYSQFAARGKVPTIERSQDVIIHSIYYSAIILAATLMLLPLRRLVSLYMYALSAGLLAVAHYLSYQYVETEQATFHDPDLDPEDGDLDDMWIKRLVYAIAAQCMISAAVAYLLNLRSGAHACLLVYTLPMVVRTLALPTTLDLHRIHTAATVLACLATALHLAQHIPGLVQSAISGVESAERAVRAFGWAPLLVATWLRVRIPRQFLLFWCSLFASHLFHYINAGRLAGKENLPVLLLACVGESVATPVSLLGICVTISYASYIVLTLTKIYLQGRQVLQQDNIMHHGWTEGFTMFLLAVQTGLIDLKTPERAFLMSIVLFIVVSSLIQSMFEIADPILLALGASHDRRLGRHARVLILCTFLWAFPLYMTRAIRHFFELDFWLLVVVSSCLLTSVQVLGSLAVYTLFIYDSLRETAWESLDDIVYYAKATTRVLEFIVAVFVVCYGVKESLTGDWSVMNSSILLVHCYFNVWQRLQAGWKSYLLRREAVKKIESLPLASERQIEELDDVCAICFQELNSARITPCHHFFHGICLKKWLYVQENCPMCHQKISLVKENPVNDFEHGGGGDGAPERLQNNNEHPGEDGEMEASGQQNYMASGHQHTETTESECKHKNKNNSNSSDACASSLKNCGKESVSNVDFDYLKEANVDSKVDDSRFKIQKAAYDEGQVVDLSDSGRGSSPVDSKNSSM